MLREWTQRRREMAEERSQRHEAHFLSLSSLGWRASHATATWRASSERKAAEKVGHAGKVRISQGENVQQQLRPGLSPALAQPPLRTVLLTHVSTYSQWTQSPHYIRAPSMLKCLELSKEIRNLHLGMSAWLCPTYSMCFWLVPVCMCVYVCFLYSVLAVEPF